MKKKFIIIIAVVLSILIPLQNIAMAKVDNPASGKKTVLIKYKNNNDSLTINESGSNIKVKKNLRNKKVKLVEADDITIKKLRKDKNVLYVEEDSTIKKSDDKITWNVEKVKAPLLQRKNYSGKGIRVAVFDTGIDVKNKDLNVVGGVSFVDGVKTYSDDNGHGTAMASILSAIKNDSGYLGVAPEIDLYSLKVLDKNGEGKYSSIIDGLQWAIDNNINIVSMSLGGLEYSKILQDAINEAYAHNILILGASGNSGNKEQVDFPARFKNVICVGATDENNKIATFSNGGSQLDIVAPGVSIETVGLNSKSQKISGTSAAVPHVAGIAAQIWGSKKTITNKQMRDILLGSAKTLGVHDTYGYGLVDGETSLKNINKNFNIPEKAEVTGGTDNGDGSVQALLIKYSGDNQHIKLGKSAVLGLQYSENHDDVQVTITRDSHIVKSEIISVEGEFPYGTVTYYTCDSNVLNEIGEYKVNFHCPEHPGADEEFTIYVVNQPQNPAGLSLEPHTYYIYTSWNSVPGALSYDLEIDGASPIRVSTSSYATGDLIPNTPHTFRVRAVNEVGEGNWSESAFCYTLAAIPTEREGVFNPKELSVTMNWQDNGNAAGTPYKIILYNENGTLIKENDWTTNLSDTIGGLDYLKTYIIKIKAKNFEGIETDWYELGRVVVPPRAQCDQGKLGEQYGYYNTDTQMCINEPVNIVTGNYYDNEEDINIPDIGLPLQIQRSYNSIDSKVGIIGKSWRINYESNISFDSATGNVKVTYPDGHIGEFIPKTGGNEFTGPQGIFELLTKDSKGIYSLRLKDNSVYKYNSNGKLISISDKNDNTITIAYDTLGQLSTITGESGKKLTFTFENGRIKSISDPSNRTLSYYYDSKGNLSKVKRIGGGEKNYTYGEYGLTSITDENNKKFIENEYDKFNRIIRQFDEDRNEVTYTYDEYAQETVCHYVASNITETYKYNDNLYVTKVTYNDNTYEEYTFDKWGNKDSIRDRKGNITRYEYNERGNLLFVISRAPFSYKTSLVYDENDNIEQVTTAGGAVTSYTYDEKGNIKTVTNKIDDSQNAVTMYEYDSHGRITSQTNPEGAITRYEYANNPNPVKITGPEGEITTFTYDALNRKSTSTDDSGTVTYEYNDKSLIEKLIDRDNNVTRYKYDSVGNLIKLIKPEQYNPELDDGIGSTYKYDAMDRPVKEIDGLGNVNAVKYDEFGNITKQINPNYFNSSTDDGLGYGYTYDSNKRLIKMINPSGKKSRIKYDAVGNKIKEIDANNYNESTDDGPGIEYSYDELNRLTTVWDAAGNVIDSFIYDADGHVIKEIDGKGYLSGSTDESRYGTVSKLNAAGWLTEQRKPVKNQNGTIYYQITRYTYDKNGNKLKEITSQDYVTLTGEPEHWNTITYQYNKSGKAIKVTDSVGGQVEYLYNSLGQLQMESSLVNGQNSNKTYYTYNKLGKVATIKREILSKDLANPDSEDVTYAVTSFKYDKNGNVISTERPEGYKTDYKYDVLGRLISQKEQVTSNEITQYNTSISVNSTKPAVFPGEEVDYQVKINPDRKVSGIDIYLEYDNRICEYISSRQENADIKVEEAYSGKLRISGVTTEIDKETVLTSLRFKIKDGVTGKGYITINPLSTYTGDDGSKYKFSEGTGKVVSGKTLDMNGDGKVQTNDFTLMAKNEDATLYELKYDEKYDIDGNGKIDAVDLNYMKDRLFSENPNPSDLKTVEQAKFYEKFSNAVYSEKQISGVRETSYEYDKAGNLIKEKYKDGAIEYTYDAYNRPVTVKDKEGNISRVFYDEVGNTTKEIQPGSYNSSTDNGAGTEYKYDAMNRLVEIKDALGNVIQRNVYDINGQVVKAIDAAGYLSGSSDSARYGIEYTYDIGNRVQSITKPEAKTRTEASSKYEYDALGNVVAYTDGENNTTRYTFDMWGKPTKVIDPYGIVTAYSYDNAGNLSEMVDGNNNKTVYIYNSLNQLGEMIDPLGKRVVYKYDREGRIKQQTHRNGQTLVVSYNSDNNITNESIIGKGDQRKFLYNQDGCLLAAITDSYVDSFTYTLNGRILSQTRNGKNILSYSYDKNGNVTGVTDQTGKTTEYVYDSINNLKSVKDGNDILAAYTYNPDSTVSNINYKNGIKISYNYNKDKNVTSLVQKDTKGKTINSFDYTYDNNGNELSKNENGIETSYTYDKMNRLLTAGTDSFTYDNAGNRATWNRGNEKIKYTYDANNRMTAVTSSNSGSIVYTYDNNGNQLTSSDGTAYTYDGFNQLKSVEQADGSWMENQYDAFGLRISVTENGIGSNFTYDRGNIITETNGSGSLVSRNIRGLGLVARDNPIGTKAYYLNNAHGDVSKLVNENGEVLNSYQYDAFGNTTNSKEKIQNRFQYAGEQLDKVTGQYYLRARHYDPTTGRFITEDTYRGQLGNTKSLNLYTYCENNPIIYVDPSGHYYIVQNKKIVSNIHLEKDTWWTAALKTITGHFVPFGGLLNDTIEREVGVIGGNSATDYGVKDLASDIVGSLFDAVDNQYISAVYGLLTDGKDVLDKIKGWDIYRMDKIAFDLMWKNDIDTNAYLWEKNELIDTMDRAYTYILSNYKYFSQQVVGDNTLYQLHSRINNAKNRDKEIEKIVKQYQSQLISDYSIDDIKIMGNTFRNHFLSNWRELLDKATNGFGSYVKKCS